MVVACDTQNEKKIKCEFHIMENDDMDAIKWLTGYKHQVDLPERFQEHAQLKRWCEENCEEVVCFYQSSYGPSSRLYFFLETDAMACKLVWTCNE